MAGIIIMQDASEVIPFDDPAFPIFIGTGTLSAYPNRRMLCHWHDEIELVTVQSGSMRYRVGEQTLLLSPGDTLFVNSRQLHYGFESSDPDCVYTCILCHPDLLGQTNRVLSHRYLEPVLENRSMAYLHFKAGDKDAKTIYDLAEHICREKQSNAPALELECLSKIYALWKIIFAYCALVHTEPKDYSDESLQKDMVAYIRKHFSGHITLSDIAASGHICQNKCCVIFRRYLQQSPIDFLNAYRLEVSCDLLSRTEKNISEIALSCGFNHSSYYTKLFQRKYGCTPTAWRKQHSDIR